MDVLRKNQKWVSPLPVMVLVALCFGIIQCSAGNPKTAAEYLETANIHLDNKEYARAIEPLTKSIELDPANPDVWNSRAYAYYFLQDFEKAIADYTETLRLEPEMGVAWVFRAQAYTQLGEHEKAAADMKAITSLIEAQKAENQIIGH